MDLGDSLLWITLGTLAYFALSLLRAIIFPPTPKVFRYEPKMVGDINLDELSKYNGMDPYRPILFAVRGKVYDVTTANGFYGFGGGYHVFAGREIARALGKMAINAAECNDDLSDFTDKQHSTLQEWETKFEEKYTVVGQVVPLKQLSAQELARHDGSDEQLPILLSVRGVVFDVTKGRDFYGPDGAYPFGGRECSRALAKFSTELADCNDDLEGCSLAEMDALRDWEGRFHSKYPIIGRLVKS